MTSTLRSALLVGLGAAMAATATASLAAGPAAAAARCPIGLGFDYLGTRVLQEDAGKPWLFATETKLVDADGAPNAYHPADVGSGCPHDGIGLDCLPNAGYPDEPWWPQVLVPDPGAPDRALVKEDGPFAGYFVSMTSLANLAYAGPLSSDSFVDASRVPYLVVPAPMLASEGIGSIGDIGYAIDLTSGRTTPFVVGDEGPLEPLGEASLAFWRALSGGAPNPRDGTGLPPGPVAVVVFPGTNKASDLGWPIDVRRLTSAADQPLAAFGGAAALRACARAALESGAVPTGDVASISFAASAPNGSSWEPHEAAAPFDEDFPSRGKCETALGEASATGPEHLRSLFHQATCVTVQQAGQQRYAIKIAWARAAFGLSRF